LILAERLVGIDARFIAYDKDYQGIKQDGSFKTEELKWAYEADILVRHRAIPDKLHNSGIPIVMAMHGRPESSFKLEQNKSNPIISAFSNKAKDERYKAFVTFWPEYVDLWSSIIPAKKLFYVPSMVDLDGYSPDNKPVELGDSPNVLISDIWREDVTPFNVIFSAVKFVKKHGGKIHLLGIGDDCIKPITPILNGLKECLGTTAGLVRDIKGYYTGADLLITPHVIATRSIREALASGLLVVAGAGCKYTPYQANPMDVDEFAHQIEYCWNNTEAMQPRKIAEAEFNLEQSGKAMKEVFKKVLKKRHGKRKVFIDIGGHLGETVRRFYREKPDADEYEIYSFEPDLDTFKLLDANVGHIKNVTLVNAMMGTKDGMADFFVGKANQNEGGTSLKGKQTGRVDYQKPSKVESINLARWLRSNINTSDCVILKMNIEGGEYDLMELLLDEDLTGLIKKCFIQLHAHKFEHGKQRQRFQQIEARFFNEAKCKVFMKNKGFYPFNA
jgi:FkbM family methyltransferase